MDIIASVSRLAPPAHHLFGRGIQRCVGATHCFRQQLRPAARRLHGLLRCLRRRQATDAEVRDMQADFDVCFPSNEDVGRLEIAMHDGWLGPVSVGDDFSQP